MATCTCLPRRGTSRTCVDLQLLGDAVVSGVGGVGADQVHLAQVQLVLDDVREVPAPLTESGPRAANCSGAIATVIFCSGWRTRIFFLAQCRTGGADLTHGLHESQQVRLVSESGCLGQSARCTGVHR